MSIKALLITLSVVLIIGSVLGWFAKGCTIPKALPEIKKDTTYVERTELQPVKKDSTISFKIEKGKTQKRVDKISIKDSLGQSSNVVIRTTVVDDSVSLDIQLESLPIKFIEHTITEITKPKIEYVEAPWYSNSWFWKTCIAVGLLIISLFN